MEKEHLELLEQWRLAKEAADKVKDVIAKEQALRKEVFASFFPTPKEGTNNLKLPEGWVLKGVYNLGRKIDEAALPAVSLQLREIGVNADTLVGWEPKLKTATYKELTAEQRAIFDQALVIKPASPGVALVAPKVKE